MLQINHPTTDAALPSFHRAELLEVSRELQQVYDCWSLLRDRKTHYLPKEVKEPDLAYKGRVARAVYSSFFKDAIRSFAGKLSKFNLTDAPQSLDLASHDVDRLGSDLVMFLSEADCLVMRDGGCAILSDMPPADSELGIASLGMEREVGRRPHWVLLDRSSILNWQSEIRNGVEHLAQVTIRELRQETVGRFGVTTVPYYRVLRPGSYELWRLDASASTAAQGAAAYTPVLVDAGPVLGAGREPLDFIPIKWYGSTSSSFGSSDLPLLALSSLSIQHFQASSDLRELLHKTALPVPVRKGHIASAAGEEASELTIGPNSALDIPIDGDFYFAEPAATSLAQHQSEIKHLEELMDRMTMNFLYGEAVSRSATEAVMSGAAIQANLLHIAQQKTSCYSSILEHWTAFTGEEISAESGLYIDPSIIDKPMSPDQVGRVLDMVGSKVISRATALEELIQGQVLTTVEKSKEEMRRVDQETDEDQSRAVERAKEEAEIGAKLRKQEYESAATTQMRADKPQKLQDPAT